jgi:poly(3-hydroxybutyrate) depolymerase
LHANGRTKQTVLDGVWREVADDLGLVLLAPSGRIPAGTDPEQGMQWTDDLARYAARAWYYEKPVRDAVAQVRGSHAIDPERIFLVGEEFR